jgi:aryl-alcohol dehydrogenase-like predicted oxidoreductase
MSFVGSGKAGAQWGIDEEESRAIVRKAVDLGINFFDTANVYASGASEEILGRALRDFARRDEVVLATKVNGPMHQVPNAKGLSRKSIFREIDDSLRRLGTDYVDLYLIHRWDPCTPIEETMEALHDIKKAGKVRYIGASSMSAWQFQKALYVAEKQGWTRFIAMQNHYNLIQREEEREMLPFCQAEGIAVTPYSPLASGRLCRDWSETTRRMETDLAAKAKYNATTDIDRAIIEKVAKIANERGISRTQIALAWLLQKEPVVSPIVGVTKMEQLEDSVASLAVSLSLEEVAALEGLYAPHATSFIR